MYGILLVGCPDLLIRRLFVHLGLILAIHIHQHLAISTFVDNEKSLVCVACTMVTRGIKGRKKTEG